MKNNIYTVLAVAEVDIFELSASILYYIYNQTMNHEK